MMPLQQVIQLVVKTKMRDICIRLQILVSRLEITF